MLSRVTELCLCDRARGLGHHTILNMRIFIGIDLDPEIRARIARFLEGVQGFAPEARWVRPESLHITLKFIGEQTPEQVEAITERCGGSKAARSKFAAPDTDSSRQRKLRAYSGSEFMPGRNSPNWPTSIDAAVRPNSAFRARIGHTVRI